MTKLTGGTVASIWQRDKRRCWICLHGVNRTDASRDHMKPRGLGGYNKSSNYRLAHKRCNTARARMPIDRVLAIRASMPGASAEAIRQALLQFQRDERKAANG